MLFAYYDKDGVGNLQYGWTLGGMGGMIWKGEWRILMEWRMWMGAELVYVDGCGRYGYDIFFEMGVRYKEGVGLKIVIQHPLPTTNAKHRDCLVFL